MRKAVKRIILFITRTATQALAGAALREVFSMLAKLLAAWSDSD